MKLRACIHVFAVILAFAAFTSPAFAGRVESGHSAMWIDPDRPGEGWIVEILSKSNAALYWYTSDEEGHPNWIISTGTIYRSTEGDRIIFSDLYTGRGGRFATGVPIDAVSLQRVGHAEIEFSDCNRGEFSFVAYDVEATYPLTRLTNTAGVTTCAPAEEDDPESGLVPMDIGTSGTWFDLQSLGGPVFTLQWLGDGRAILFWFAYDNEGNPYWAGGIGQINSDLLVFEQLSSVHGVRFGEDTPPEETKTVPWGRVEFMLSCEAAILTYDATEAGFGAGSFALTPLTRLAEPDCAPPSS